MKILATPGTTYKIKANSHILTHPTVGPLFGSYKFQMDIFTGAFTDIWYKCQGYMDTDHVGLEEILELMQHNWLKEFELLV